MGPLGENEPVSELPCLFLLEATISTSRPLSARIRTRNSTSQPLTLHQKLCTSSLVAHSNNNNNNNNHGNNNTNNSNISSSNKATRNESALKKRVMIEEEVDSFEGSSLTHGKKRLVLEIVDLFKENLRNLAPYALPHGRVIKFEIYHSFFVGNVLCGNPVTALRRRKQKEKTSAAKPSAPYKQQSQQQQQTSMRQFARGRPSPKKFEAEHSYLSVEEDGVDKDDVLEELKAWRMKNKRYSLESLL